MSSVMIAHVYCNWDVPEFHNLPSHVIYLDLFVVLHRVQQPGSYSDR